jgi:dipeptidyl aminopeptidase/acylaminoacyl peptidase
MRKNFLLAVLCTCAIFYDVSAQDGKIISQLPYFFPDSFINKVQKINPSAREIFSNVDFYKITYISDGLKVTGYLSMPKAKGKFPCVIFNRGGNREFGAMNAATIFRFLGNLSNWGYVAVASQYRGNDGGEGKEEFGGKEVDDILNLIPLLSNLPNTDTSRIGMYGWSRGGMMTYLALARTNRMKAAIIGSGFADGFLNLRKRPGMDTVFMELAPGYLKNRDSVLKTRSAAYWPEKISPQTPLLLLAGSADWRVLPEEQFEMLNKLYALKHPLRFILLEGGQHSLVEHLDEVNRISRNFLDTYVRDLKPWPSLEPHGN